MKKKACCVCFSMGLLLCTAASVPGVTFDYTNPGPVVNTDSEVITVGGITSSVTTTGGVPADPLHIDANGYGVRGNNLNELNFMETLTITFSEVLVLDSILLTESNGGNNDLVEMLVDGNLYNFVTHFGSNHPEEMTNRATSTATSYSGNPVDLGWLLDFSGLGVAGQDFTFAIPEEVQSQGSGGDYQLGGMVVVPEPTTYALVLAALCLAMGRRRTAVGRQ